jgi:hypothetical protein
MAISNSAKQRVFIGANVDAEQRERLTEIAARDDRSVSSVIRQAISSYVTREQTDREFRDMKVKAATFRPIPTNEREKPWTDV